MKRFDNFFLKLYFAVKIPLIFFTRAKIIKSTPKEVVIKIPFIRRNKNHLGSMYFGSLSVGADLAGGLIVLNCLRNKKSKARLVFKDFKANFLKRPHDHVYFHVKTDITIIEEKINENKTSGERVNFPINIIAICQNQVVAKFVLTTSIK